MTINKFQSVSYPRLVIIAISILCCSIFFGWLHGQYLFVSRADAADEIPPPSPVTVTAASVPTSSGYVDFPHIGAYGQYRTSGWPLVGLPGSSNASPTDPLNESVMDGYARHQRVILQLTPGADARPDILTSLRERNPSISIFGYALGYQVFCPADGNGNVAYAANTYSGAVFRAVTGGITACNSSTDRFLWLQDGTKPDALNINVNIAHRVQNPDTSYTYDVAEAVAEAMYEYARPGRNWDGFQLDVFCSSIIWMESPGVLFDYARAGYCNNNSDLANRTAFDQGWQAGHLRLHQRLRELAIADGHPDFPIFGNCGGGPASTFSTMNGWMRENFPWLEGGTFNSNLFGWRTGYLHQDYLYRAPQENFLNTAPNQDGPDPLEPTSTYNPYSAGNIRRMRYGLGAATLGNGTSIFNIQSFVPSDGSWWNWWYDEYGVRTNVAQSDPSYGQSATGAQYLGWLGQPLTPAYSQLSDNFTAGSDLFSENLGFETEGGSPTTAANWTTSTDPSSNATVTRDTTTSAEGSASMKAVVGIGDPAGFGKVRLSNSTFFAVTANDEYSITFKAKASAKLPLHVTTHFGPAANLTIPIDTEWRQYQAVVKPDSTDNTVLFRFEFGLAAGTYWVDDVHVKAGASSVWRRDFDKGSVFVNPTGSVQTITLSDPMKKIAGTVNPALNDGSTVSSFSLAATSGGAGYGDAIFLLSIDATPPAPTTDLRAQ